MENEAANPTSEAMKFPVGGHGYARRRPMGSDDSFTETLMLSGGSLFPESGGDISSVREEV